VTVKNGVFWDIETQFVPHRKHGPMGLWASTVCYKDGFTFLYVADVRTPQDTCIWASLVCHGDSFTFFRGWCSYITGNIPMGLHVLLQIWLYFLNVADIRTPQETHLLASTACYRHRFTLLYVADVRTSQETYLWASTACYGDRFTLLYVPDVRTSQETYLWASTACYGVRFTLLYVADVRTS
jgi:hypothetical protein